MSAEPSRRAIISGSTLAPAPVPAAVRFVFLGLIACWGTLLVLVTIASLPYSPLSMALDVEIGIRSLVPEGWGFFTRAPRSLDLYVSQRVGDAWVPLPHLPIAHPRNLFGVDRRPRAIPIELAVLLDQVPKADWREYPDGFDARAELPRPVRVTNTMEHPLLCGHVRVLSREPVPWAWFASGDLVAMPSWAVVLDVQCSHGSFNASTS
jgi:antimicrobial peptide system SdpA family protein